MPLLRHAACNSLNRANFLVPPGLPMKWKLCCHLVLHLWNLQLISLFFCKPAAARNCLDGFCWDYPTADIVLLVHQDSSRGILLLQVLLVLCQVLGNKIFQWWMTLAKTTLKILQHHLLSKHLCYTLVCDVIHEHEMPPFVIIKYYMHCIAM